MELDLELITLMPKHHVVVDHLSLYKSKKIYPTIVKPIRDSGVARYISPVANFTIEKINNRIPNGNKKA